MLTATLIGGTALAGLGTAFFAAQRQVKQIENDHPPGGEFITVDGIRLHYRISGPDDRPTVLILHGAASNLEEPYFCLSPAFREERVIWLDRPGLGWSERPSGKNWSPALEADLIARFLSALNIEDADVVGHSWGGAIAMRLAIDHPERVNGLVLVAPALSAWIGDAAWFNKASFWPLLGPAITRLAVPLTGIGALASGAVKACHPEPVPENYLQTGALPLLLRPSNWIANAEDMKRVNHHLADQQEAYADVEHATVFLAAKGDTVLWTKKHAGAVSQRMKNAELRWIEGAGHNLHHHHGAKVLDAVRTARQRGTR